MDWQLAKKQTIQAFRELNINLLNDVLEEGSYNGASKSVYLEKIEDIFCDMKYYGDSHMEIYEGKCTEKSCNHDVPGFQGVGNITRSSLSIIFESDLKKPFTIVYCSKLATYEDPGFIAVDRTIKIYENEKMNPIYSESFEKYTDEARKVLNEVDFEKVYDFTELYEWTLTFLPILDKMWGYRDENGLTWKNYSEPLFLFCNYLGYIQSAYLMDDEWELYEKARNEYLMLENNIKSKQQWFLKYRYLYDFGKHWFDLFDMSIKQGDKDYLELGRFRIKKEPNNLLVWFYFYFVQPYRMTFS